MRNALQEAVDKAKNANKEVKDLKSKEAGAKEEKDTLQQDLQAQTKEKTKLEFTLKDLRDEVAGDSSSKERAEQELNKLKVTIKEKEKELENIKPAYDEMRKKEDEYTRELSLKEQKRKELYAKQGRGSQFTSKAQRDEWIQKELKSLNKQIKDKTEQIERLGEDLKRDSKKKNELETKIDELGGT